MNPTEGSVDTRGAQARETVASCAALAPRHASHGARPLGLRASSTGQREPAPASTPTPTPGVEDGSFAAGSHPELNANERAQMREIEAELIEGEADVSTWKARRAELMCRAAQIAADASSRGERNSRSLEMPYRSISAQLATGLRISDRTVERELNEAPRLVHEFPATHASLRAARISAAHADAIARAGANLPDAQARADYEAEIVPIAERETPGRTRHLAGVVAARVDGRTFAERHATAAAGRGVRIVDLTDGMSELIATVPTVFAHAVRDRLIEMAHSVIDARGPRRARRTAGAGAGFGRAARARTDVAGDDEGQAEDVRTVNEVCADAFLELCLAGTPTAHSGTTALGEIKGRVQITVSMLTLMGRNDHPATLAGAGPIDAATARLIAGATPGWDRVLVHPVTGAVLAVDRYTPNADLKRALRVRDQHCRFPGCRLPVHRTDLDHTVDYALGGETRADNLAHLCRRHHTMKHASAWTVVQKPGGVLEWTSPTGKVHTDLPVSTVMFKPEADWNDWLASANTTSADAPPPF